MGAAMSLFFICSNAFAQQGDNNEPVSDSQKADIIRKAISLLKENYIFPQRVGAIAAKLNSPASRQKYADTHTLFAFLEQFNQDLETSGHDKHLDVFYGPQIVAKIRKEESTTDPTAVPPEYLRLLAYENYRLRKAERMDGNIGYLKLNGFVEPELSKEVLASAINFIAHASAVILDLRENGGGSAAAAHLLMSCFLPDSTLLGEFSNRRGEAIKLYTRAEAGMVRLPDVPLYILVSSRTSSAAEAVAYSLQQLKRATVVGEITHGEANPGMRFAITDKLYMMIPTAVNRNAVTGTNWDGVGVLPDITTDAETALPAAVVEACNTLAKSGTNNIYQWMLPEYKAQVHPQVPSENLLQSIVGRYAGGRQITREEGACYYLSGSRKYRMSYLGDNTFLLEGRKEIRIRFAENGVLRRDATFLWNDGTSETVRSVP